MLSMDARSLRAITVVMVTLAACRAVEPSNEVIDDGAITIASFAFAESELVAEIYAGALREAGFDTTHLRRAGSREMLLPALERGLIEVVPEYSGSAVSFLGGAATSDAAATAASLDSLVGPRGLDALAPSSAQSRNALVVNSATADRLSLRTISDLVSSAEQMSLGGPPECPDRPLCLPGFERAYGLTFGSFLPLDVGGPVTADAVERGTVDVGVLFTSDGHLAQGDLVLLRDDRHLQPAESIIPVVRRDAVERFGQGLIDVLDLVSARLTTEGLQRLNALVAQGTTIDEAAAIWLDEHWTSALRSSG